MRKITVMLLMTFVAIFGLTLTQAFADESEISTRLISYREWQQEEFLPIVDGEEGASESVTVYYGEKVYQVDTKAQTLAAPLVLTLNHSQSYSRNSSQCYLFRVKAGGRTRTNQCVDESYVKASTIGGGIETSGNPHTNGGLGCNDDTGWEYENSTWAQGTTVTTRGDHSATISGSVFSFLDEDFPTATLPYEVQCTG